MKSEIMNILVQREASCLSWHADKLEGEGSNVKTQSKVKMILTLLGNLTEADVQRIKTELGKLPGVRDVDLNLRTNRLTVAFDMRKINVEKIALRLSELGYNYVKRA